MTQIILKPVMDDTTQYKTYSTKYVEMMCQTRNQNGRKWVYGHDSYCFYSLPSRCPRMRGASQRDGVGVPRRRGHLRLPCRLLTRQGARLMHAFIDLFSHFSLNKTVYPNTMFPSSINITYLHKPCCSWRIKRYAVFFFCVRSSSDGPWIQAKAWATLTRHASPVKGPPASWPIDPTAIKLSTTTLRTTTTMTSRTTKTNCRPPLNPLASSIVGPTIG